MTAEEREFLSSCLQEARRSIHADYERAPSQFKPLFLYIEREIFSPDFTIGAARDAANLKSNSYTTRFYKITGKRPREYVEHHRIRTAQKIIRHTDIYHWQVGSLVGFSDPSVFSRNYRKVVGHSPNKEAKHNPSDSTTPGDQQAIESPNTSDPRVSLNTAEPMSPSSRLSLAELREDILDMTRSEIKAYIGAHMKDINLGHFYYFLEKSKHKARHDRAKGKELCLAALDTLRLVEFLRGEEFPDEKAVGYASLAHICQLELNFDEAERWFGIADRFLPVDPGEKPTLFAQVNFLRASLLWWKRNAAASIRLLDRILPDIRRHSPLALLARVLLLKAEIYDGCGDPDHALALFSEAVELTPFIDDSYVVFSAHFNLTLCYTRLSRPAEANAQFEKVKELSTSVDGVISPFFLSHLEGSVSRVKGDFRKAEHLFLEAREGFLNQGLDISAAFVSLELSLVYLELGQPDEAFSTAISAIPAISRHCAQQEAVAALTVLEEAEKLQRVDKAIIRQVLHQLDLVRKNPTAARSR